MNTALIVDDRDDNRYLLRVILSASGYALIEASNGVEALDKARKSRPAIIISDILMPQMDGFSLCRACKRDSALSDIPFVFYTATYTSPGDEALAMKLGAARFIVKPAADELFVSVIAEVLKEHAGGHLRTSLPPAEDETVFYRLYNEVLIDKLEKKVLALEQQIAHRQRAEAATSEGALRLQTAIRAAHVGLWDWDLRTGVMFYSREWKRQIGYEDQDISSHPSEWWDRLHPDDREPTIAALHAFAEKRRADYDAEYRFCHQDGSYRWMLAQASRIEDGCGTPIRVLGSQVDVTARKHADAEREHLQEQLAQARTMEAVGRLAGGIAHDFNNALCVIIGCAELALDRPRPDDAVQEYLQSICDAADRGAQIVRQLLALARKGSVTPVVLNPNSALTAVQGMLCRLIGEDIQLTLTLHPDVWSIRIDPSQFDQILINLLANARDAMPDAGSIAIRTANVSLDDQSAGRHVTLSPGDYLLLEVTDTGGGMDAATLQRIFDPFFTTKPDQSGTGLGLSTVLGIVEHGGGRIEARSAPREGTTFTIHLPRCIGAVPLDS